MNDEIFRKKSLDKVKSPENLDDYIRVTNPGVWMLLVSVVALLVGVCVWGIFGHVDSTAPVAVRVDGGSAVCFVAQENLFSVKEGMTVRYGDCEAEITEIGAITEEGYLRCELGGAAPVEDGFYDGEVVLRSYKPMSFVLN